MTFCMGLSAFESRGFVDRRRDRYVLSPEYVVAMVEDLANQLNSRCPERCEQHTDVGDVELEVLTERYDRPVATIES